MNVFDISNVINVNVAQQPRGLGTPNVNNIGLFSNDKPGESFGDAQFKIYRTATEVGKDFGTDSRTYKMANALFAQKPNILNGNGFLAIILLHGGSYPTPTIIDEALAMVNVSGLFTTVNLSANELLEIGRHMESLTGKIWLEVSMQSNDYMNGNTGALLVSEGCTHCRLLGYRSDEEDDAKRMLAAYIGRAFSVNQSGNNTSFPIHIS